VVNKKSKPPKKRATAKEKPITIKVYLMVSFLVGQLTFFISTLTSFKKLTILFGILDMDILVKEASPLFHLHLAIARLAFKKAHRGSALILTKIANLSTFSL